MGLNNVIRFNFRFVLEGFISHSQTWFFLIRFQHLCASFWVPLESFPNSRSFNIFYIVKNQLFHNSATLMHITGYEKNKKSTKFVPTR